MPSDLTERRRAVDRLLARRDAAAGRKRSAETAVRAAETAAEAAKAAQTLLQAVAAEVQAVAHERIASVVTRCLEAVFGVGFYEFKVDFDRKRGRTEARLSFVRDGHEMDPAEDCGGGAVDVAAFALRLAVLSLHRPPLRKALFLDESFRHVKPPEVLAPRVCDLLEQLSEELAVQIVLIPSIDRHYQVGKVVRIGG
jgi:hypothetical protein